MSEQEPIDRFDRDDGLARSIMLVRPDVARRGVWRRDGRSGRETVRMAGAIIGQRLVRLYDLWDGVATDLKNLGVHVLNERYIAGQTIHDILNAHVSLDIAEPMQRCLNGFDRCCGR